MLHTAIAGGVLSSRGWKKLHSTTTGGVWVRLAGKISLSSSRLATGPYRKKVHFPQCQVSDMFEFSYSIIFLCSQNQRKTTRNFLVFGWSAFSYLRPHLSRVWAASGFASAVIARQPFSGSPAVLLLNLLPLHYLLVQPAPDALYFAPQLPPAFTVLLQPQGGPSRALGNAVS